MRILKKCLACSLRPFPASSSFVLVWAALGFALGAQAQNIVSVSAGHRTSFYLKSDGTIWATGCNDSGQLGNGNSTGNGFGPAVSATTPELIMTAASAVSTAGGGHHTLFLKADGTAWATGDNQYGQLGNDLNQSQVSPVAVKTAGGTPITGVKAISAGAWHSLFLKEDGTVWACGRNSAGALGDGSTQDRNMAVQVTVNGVPMNGVKAISAGGSHSLFLKTDGTAWAVGDNWYGELGDGHSESSPYPDGNPVTSVPVQVLSGVKAIEAAITYSLFLKENGTVWACGDNSSGQLGNGSVSLFYYDPPISFPVQTQTGVAAISARGDHSLFLKTDGTVWGCGENLEGELGDGTTISPRATPVQMQTYGAGISAISAGLRHSLYVQNGWVATTGLNSYGQLGDGTKQNRSHPLGSSAMVVRHRRIAAPDLGTGAFSLKAECDGTVWGMGGGYGTTPSQVTGLSHILSVSPGFWRSNDAQTIRRVALDEAGKIWTWSTTVNPTPSVLPGIPDAVAIFDFPSSRAGAGLCALGKDHSVWSIGWPSLQSSPVITRIMAEYEGHVFGLNSVEQIACGQGSYLALDYDGTVWAWGVNYDGQLGDGSTTERSFAAPVLNSDGSVFRDVACVASGYRASYAVKKDGTFWAWGTGYHGDTTFGSCLFPTQVSGINDGIAVYSSGSTRYLLKRDGRVIAWGANPYGVLGDNSTTIVRYTPVVVKMNQGGVITDLTRVVEVSTNGFWTFFRREDGSIYACGLNNAGQIGGGATANKLVATLVEEF